MNVRLVHEANSLFSAATAVFLNLVLLWLVLKRAPKEMQVYCRILIQTISVDIVLALVLEFTQPIYFLKDGWMIICLNGPFFWNMEPVFLRFVLFELWLFFYMLSIFGLSVQFVYRYLVLAKSADISIPRYLLMLCVPAAVELVMCFIYYFCAMPNAQNAILPAEKVSGLLGDPIYVAYTAQSADWLYITGCGLLFLMQIVCYILIAVCGYLVVKFVRENSKLNPAHKEMNAQLTLNLIIQSILPFLLCAVNMCVIIVVICFPPSVSSSHQMQVFELFSTVPMHWLPLFNPLVTMVVVKPFRRTLLCVKPKVKNVAVPVAMPNPKKVEPKKNIRPRVATISVAHTT